jgi:outer membrane protein assembly factor BamB
MLAPHRILVAICVVALVSGPASPAAAATGPTPASGVGAVPVAAPVTTVAAAPVTATAPPVTATAPPVTATAPVAAAVDPPEDRRLYDVYSGLPGDDGAFSVPAAPADSVTPPPSGVDPAVQEAVETDGTVPVIIRLRERPDLARVARDAARAGSAAAAAVLMRHEPGLTSAEVRALARDAEQAARGRVVVNALQQVADRSQGRVLELLADHGVTDPSRLWIINGIAATVDEATLAALADHPDVASVTLDQEIRLIEPVEEDPGQPLLPTDSLEAINAPDVWGEYGVRGAGVVVGIMDTGVDATHPALASTWRGRDGDLEKSWVNTTNENYPEPGDGHGHGTHVTGTIVGSPPGGEITGVAPEATWIAAKVLSDTGNGTESDIHEGFQWMLAPGGDPAAAPDVVNNSWGNRQGSFDGFWEDVAAWVAAGIVPIFANGNDGPGTGTVGSPASYPHAIGVGATDNLGRLTWFSSRGPAVWDGVEYTKPDLSAPGYLVRSSIPVELDSDGDGYALASGTSMAAPHVTGTVALMLSAAPDLTVDEVRTALTASAARRDLAAALPNSYGAGVLDAFAAVTYVTRSGTVTGTVTGADGAPLAATVTVGDQRTTTDPQTGTYALRLTPGTYPLEISAYGFAPHRAEVTVTVGETVTVDAALAAAPERTLSGTVTGPDGPVPDARVAVADTPLVAVRTDPAGRFALSVAEGSYDLVVSAGGYAPATVPVVVDGPTDVTVDLVPAPTAPGWAEYQNNPARTGRSGESLAGETLQHLWSVGLGGVPFFASPVIADGRVFVNLDDGRLAAFDLSDGNQLWTFAGSSGMRGTPAVSDGVVYTGGGTAGGIHAVSAATGELIWKLETPGRRTIYTSPTVVDGVVYVATGFTTTASDTVYALDADTGAVLWSRDVGPRVFGGPAVADGLLFVASASAQTLYALDAATGSPVWTYELTGEDEFIGSPSVADGTVYVTTSVPPDGLAPGFQGKLLAIDAATGQVRWEAPGHGDGQGTAPAVHGDLVIAGSHGLGMVAAYDRHTGEPVWYYGLEVSGGVSASVLVSGDGYVVAGAQIDDRVFALDATDGSLVWEQTLPDSVLSSPAYADGRLVVADSRGNLHAYQPTGQVRGVVTGPDGPLAAMVRVVEADREVTADPDTGAYLIAGLPPGDYTLEVSHYGFATATESVRVLVAQAVTVDVDLAPVGDGAVTGVVTDQDGRPLAGVSVTLAGTPLEPVVTGEDGAFAFPQVAAGTFRIEMSLAGYEAFTDTVTVVEGQTTVVDATLQRFEVAVVADYEGRVTQLLRDAGWRTDRLSFAEIDGNLDRYEVVVLSGMTGDQANADLDRFARIVADADAAGTSLVVLGTGGPSYGSVRTLSQVTGDPAVEAAALSADGVVFLHDVVPHPITASLPTGAAVPVLTPNSWHAWFSGYSGHTLAMLSSQDEGLRGGGVGYQRRTVDSNHILLPSAAPSPFATWEPAMEDLIRDAVAYAATAAYGEVTGVVTGPDGAPVAATVEVPGDLERATAADDGSYSLLLPPGEHTLRFRWPGARTVELPVTVVAGEVHVRDVSLPTSDLGTVAGVVTSADGGAPVDGATVSVPGSGQPPATTGPDGRYAVEDLPGGTYTVEFTAPGYEPVSVEAVEVVEGAVTTLDVALTPAPPVVVVGDRNSQLTDFLRGNGVPAEEAGWEVVDDLDGLEVVVLNNPPTVDRDTFLAALEAFDAADVSVIFPAAGLGSVRTNGINMLVQYTGDPSDHVWIGSGDPEFFLHDLADHPIFEGIESDPVQILHAGPDAAYFPQYSGVPLAQVARAGEEPAGLGVAYQPRTLDAVHLLLTGLAASSASNPAIDWTDEGRRIFLNSVRWAADPQQSGLSGVVTGPDGQPVTHAVVELLGTNWRAEVDEDGAFELAVAPGEYTLRYTAFGYVTVERAVTLGPGQTADASLELQVADVGSISGVVTSAGTGARLPDVSVTLRGTPFRTATGPDGTFSFSLVEPGDYELELEVDGHVRSLVPVTVTAGQTTQRDVALRESPRVGIIGDSDFANSRDRGKEFLADWGYLAEDIGFDSLDRIPELDLVIANASDAALELTFEQFKAFEDAVNRAGVPVLWMGQHERGAIRFLQQYDGNPTEVGQGTNHGAIIATVVADQADHPLVAGVPDQFELLDAGSRYSYIDGYDGQIVATLSTTATGEVGTAIAYRGRTAGTVDVLLSTMSITTWGAPSTRERPAVEWTPHTERVLVNALEWALDARGLAAEVRGTVESDLGGRIPSRVTVLETGRTYQGRSGDGTFLVPLQPGTWTLHVDSFGHAAQAFEVTVEAGDVETVALTLAAEPAGSVTGTVTAPDGRGLSGATVSIVDSPLVTTTGADGTFTFDRVPPGEWTVRVTADGHLASEVPVTVAVGQTSPVTVQLRESPRVAVVVTTLTQEPFVALLDLLADEGYDTEAFTRTGMATIAATIEDYDLVILNTSLVASSMPDFEALLTAAEQAGVSVVVGGAGGTGWPLRFLSDLRGDPASVISSNVRVGLDLVPTQPHPIFAGYPVGERIPVNTSTTSNQNQLYTAYTGYSGTTIADVHDRVDGVRLGESVGYRFSSPTSVELLLGNLTPTTSDGAWPGEGWSEDASRIYLNAIRWAVDATQAQLVGTVTGGGQPLEGATVTAVEAGQTTVTASDGTYVLGLGPGSHTVRISAFGFATVEHTVEVPESGTVTLDVDLAPLPRGEVTGTVRSASGEAVAGATVTGTGVLEWEVTTGPDGTFTVGDLLEGDYQVTVTADGFLPADAEVTVTAEATAVLDVTLQPTVVGVLGDVDGVLTAYLRDAGVPATELQWRADLDVERYEALVVNGGDPDADTFAAVLAAADAAQTSLVFTGTWAVDRGGIRLLERYTDRVEVGTQGHGDGPVQLTGFDPDHRLFAGLGDDPATLIVEGGYYSVLARYAGRPLADLHVPTADGEPVTGLAVGWDWRSAGSIEVLLSASAVTEAVGPGKGWTADAGRLLVNAIEWAREAQLDPPAAPVLQAVPATVAESVTVTGTSEWPWPVTVSVDGTPVATATPAEDGSFSVEVPLAVGENTITAVAENLAGASPVSAPVTVTRWVPEWDVTGGGPTRVVRLSLAGHDRLTAPADSATLVLRDADGNEVAREPLRWAAVSYLAVLTRLPAGDLRLAAELEVDGHVVTIDGPPVD